MNPLIDNLTDILGQRPEPLGISRLRSLRTIDFLLYRLKRQPRMRGHLRSTPGRMGSLRLIGTLLLHRPCWRVELLDGLWLLLIFLEVEQLLGHMGFVRGLGVGDDGGDPEVHPGRTLSGFVQCGDFTGGCVAIRGV